MRIKASPNIRETQLLTKMSDSNTYMDEDETNHTILPHHVRMPTQQNPAPKIDAYYCAK